MNAASSKKESLPKLATPSTPRLIASIEPEASGEGEPCIGGMVPFPSVDWPLRLAAVLFLAGCPWRCHYCHNPHLQTRTGRYSWSELLAWLGRRRGLLEGVVFSGGEPLSEPQLERMIVTTKEMGFDVALHTAGIYPKRLAQVLPYLDWVGLDVKTHASGHDKLTGRPRSHAPMNACLDMLIAWQGNFECRTTWSPNWLSEDELLTLANDLAQRGVRRYAVQNHRASPNDPPRFHLSVNAQATLHAWFDHFEYR